MKLLHCYNLFAGTEMLSLSVYEPIVMQILLRGTFPEFEEGVELGGRVCYPLKVLHIRYNLFAGTEMLSLSVYEPIAIQILIGELPPICGEGVEVMGRMWYHMKGNHNGYNLSFETNTISRSV